MNKVIKKILIFSIILNFLVGGFGKIIAIKINNEDNISNNIYNTSKGQGPYDEIIDIPKYSFNLSKAPNEYYESGKKNPAFEGEYNFPIGSFGNNYISYGPHGIDRISLYNNFFDTFGGSFGTGSYKPRCLDGTFLSVYMKQGENKTTRLLQEYSPDERSAKNYGIEPIEKMDCYSNIPTGYYKYKDTDFPAELGLVVYSPIILYDLKNSSLPTSIWLFNAYNPTNEPVEISFLFSLENDIGWRDNVDDDDSWQRNGTYNYYWEDEDIAGIKFSYDKNLMTSSHPEYLGGMTLATPKQENVTISYISEWNTKGDGSDLLTDFSSKGILNNKNISKRAIEGKSIYAGALSTKITLEPGEGKKIPFVLSTCFPIFNLSNDDGMPSDALYDWYWNNFFNNSWDIASYSLENSNIWFEKINKWQSNLYKSSLPDEIITYMISSLTTFVAGSFFSKEGYWFTYTWGLEGIQVSSYSDWFLCMFYPDIEKYAVLEYCDAVDRHNGFCPGSLLDKMSVLHLEPYFVIRAYRAWLWNQNDLEFLNRIYPSCKNATNYRISKDVEDDGLIHNIGNDLRNDMWSMPLSSYLNSEWLLALACMESMAKHLNYTEDIKYYEEFSKKAQKSFIETFWYDSGKHEYFKLCGKKYGKWGWGLNLTDPFGFPLPVAILDSKVCMIEQITGGWHGKLVDIDILPKNMIKTAIKTIYDINQDYSNNLGWITAVRGNFPYLIDSHGTYLYNAANRILACDQWELASLLLSYGFKDEAMHVAITAKENNLYKKGGTYNGDDLSVNLVGTNSFNKLGQTLVDKFFGMIMDYINKKGLVGGKEDYLGPPYPPRIMFDAPSWSFYQSSAGFTPTIGGLKIKPNIVSNNSFYMTKFADCEVELTINGNGSEIEYAEINGKTCDLSENGSIFIPLERFHGKDKINISFFLI